MNQDQFILAAIVSSIDDAIIGKNLRGSITSWNPAAERIFGYTAQEAIGEVLGLLVPANLQHEQNDVRRAGLGPGEPMYVPPRNGTRILVVDDDQDALARSREILELTAAVVITADSGQDALSKPVTHGPTY